MAIERFWYVRGPMLMIGMAYGITLVLAALTFASLGPPPLATPPDRIADPVVQVAQILPASRQVTSSPALSAALQEPSKIAACP